LLLELDERAKKDPIITQNKNPSLLLLGHPVFSLFTHLIQKLPSSRIASYLPKDEHLG
jgi:hypothetical protein